MATFTVNGQTVQAEKNQKLIRFLRDELRLTSVKDGCSEGACGTCHVLIDGKATKACVHDLAAEAFYHFTVSLHTGANSGNAAATFVGISFP